MAVTWCEVIVKTPDGKQHSGRFQAKSVFDAAAQMHSQLMQRKVGVVPVELPPETFFEVRPIYRVKQRVVAKWVTIQEARNARINVRHKR